VGFWGTHGCVRLFDDDIQFVFENAPVGTPVYIY
jgi:lipoprotein-anchoring transpeptidase ErfK/SrfK